MDTQQIIGYIVTGLWSLVNIGAFVVIIAFFVVIFAFFVRLYKYLGKSDKSHKGADV